jgi:hypothetical protein
VPFGTSSRKVELSPGAAAVHGEDPVAVAGALGEALHDRAGLRRGGHERPGLLGIRHRLPLDAVDVGRGRRLPLQHGSGVRDGTRDETDGSCRHGGRRFDVGHLGRERVVDLGVVLRDQARHLDRSVLLEVRVVLRPRRTVREDARVDPQEHRLGGLRPDLVQVRAARGRQVDELDALLGRQLLHLVDVFGEAHIRESRRGVEAAPRHGSDQHWGRAALARAVHVGAQVLLVVGG